MRLLLAFIEATVSPFKDLCCNIVKEFISLVSVILALSGGEHTADILTPVESLPVKKLITISYIVTMS